MIISVDAMGGDNAPQDVVQGAVEASSRGQVGIILVGLQDRIKHELAKHDISGLDISIAHTDEYLVEGEQPAYALRAKRNASIAVATRLVREGKASAVFGAGPTGGVIAAALGCLGMMEGISRPVVGGPFCGFAPETVVMDLGGNVDSRPDQLIDFAIVGTVFARKVLNISNPTVATLSVGAEEGKGNDLVKGAFPLFKKSGLNFIGNVEGYDIPAGKANVVICDGFVGNVLIKFYEALGMIEARWLEKKLTGKLAESEVREVCESFLKVTNAASIGGGPIWAVNGLVMKGHGRSKHDEIALSILEAKHLVEVDMVSTLRTEIAAIRRNIQTTNS
jgi:phosphate acyltransferase